MIHKKYFKYWEVNSNGFGVGSKKKAENSKNICNVSKLLKLYDLLPLLLINQTLFNIYLTGLLYLTIFRIKFLMFHAQIDNLLYTGSEYKNTKHNLSNY